MLFYMLEKHRNITQAVINDVNPKLITCYETIRDFPKLLIESLAQIQEEYYALQSEEERKEYFLEKRDAFNGELTKLETSTLFIFLNRTCFNGLYRENKKVISMFPLVNMPLQRSVMSRLFWTTALC